MVLDPIDAIIKKLYNTITGSSEIQTLTNDNFILHRDDAGKDPQPDYFVHRLETEKNEIIKRADYYLDWYMLENATDVKRRLLILLDEQRFNTTETGLFRMENEIVYPVPELETDMTHFISRWSIKYFPKEIVEQINAR